MADPLPHGLVSNTDHVSSDLKSAEYVEIEDVAKLWRVYTTNKTTLKKGAGKRLENLFWRIWSNGRISSNISGSTLAHLFIQMTNETPLWTRDKEELGSISRNSPSTFPRLATDSASACKDSSRTQLSGNESKSPSRTSLPPSILKKPSRSSSQHRRKSTRFAFEELQNAREQGDTWREFRSSPRWAEMPCSERFNPRSRSYVPNPSPALFQPVPGMRKSAVISDNSIFDERYLRLASAFDGEIRTRKLTLEALSPTSRSAIKPKPPLIIPPLADTTCDQPLDNTSPHNSPASTPSTETQLTPRPILQRAPPCPKPPRPAEPHPTTPLVDKNFRARFVERQPRESPVSSLTTLISSEEPLSLPGSPAATDPTDFIIQPSQTSRMRDSPRAEMVLGQPPEVSLSRTLSGSPPAPISRSGSRLSARHGQDSQLSKLIEEKCKE
ncbi:uncharacterized protein CIMG_06731 [Coccidioides immitis RS]|uniref:Nitrogen regulatory protein areA GATA-like domain-containing protein n=1 Tax=Coccidioides immitis (strain RS) TaxID=246410 RepID=J3K8S6_COCIM|nr:uncharacterized protein CIMG_06731 [Coccidioides immitis RS]EAS31252.3 hypothetical protein CIMG_06731 [Coccidioides immitis RS]TPX24091.1 hypothetical protein DIZ76_013434 [Coccidioides immitis]